MTWYRIGVFALAAWLILMGMTQLLNLQFNYKEAILGILAIIAGVLMVLGVLL